MIKSERSNYTVLDFLEWQRGGRLLISPKFQRRSVWSRPAQSFLIDTVLLGLPVPPVYLRIAQSAEKTGIVREVIDGQQRMSALLQYVEDRFPLSRNIESAAVGLRFSDLNEGQKDSILQYSFICEVFYGISDPDVLKIFARLNTHSVKLNAQELRNGQYFGHFKRAAAGLAFEHLEFWRKNRIFTEQAIARMQELELTSELMVALMAGHQDKKKSIDRFYRDYDDNFPERERIESKFRTVIDVVNEYLANELKETEFRRVPMFYTLFAAVAHRLFGLPGVDLPTPATGRLRQDDGFGLQAALFELSNAIAAAKDDATAVPEQYISFVRACLRQTDNLRPRDIRLQTLYRQAFS